MTGLAALFALLQTQDGASIRKQIAARMKEGWK